MSKNIVDTEGPQLTSRYGAFAMRDGLTRLNARMRMHTHTRPGTHMNARTHAQACTHRRIDNTYCFPQQQWFRERAGMWRYTHVPCLVTPHIEIVSNVRVTHLQPLWGFLYNSKAKLGFCKKCRHKFRRKFPGVPFLQRKRKRTDTWTFEQHLSR
jgi:hypothetical protein